ncbi:MAG: hypothetical protein ACR2HA_13475 [Nocardioides sp.]
MSEFSGYFDRLADQQIRERISQRQLFPSVERRPRGRHALAHRLHRLADRFDG